MDKIFVKVNEFSFSSRDMDNVNDFLEKIQIMQLLQSLQFPSICAEKHIVEDIMELLL